MDIAKGLGIEKIINDYWDTPVPPEDLAETIVLAQQSKVLHREEEFWTDDVVFVRKMLPIARAYQKEVKNLIAKETRSNGREEALKVKGALRLSWTEMAPLPELRDACRTNLISKTGYLSPSSLNEKRFVKLLVDY